MSTYPLVEDWDTSRTGEPWTPMDVHIALRTNLTDKERAKLLKRTYAAVRTKRSELLAEER